MNDFNDYDKWLRDYTQNLSEQNNNRCADCIHVRMGTTVECDLLNIVIANARKSRCPGHSGRTTT